MGPGDPAAKCTHVPATVGEPSEEAHVKLFRPGLSIVPRSRLNKGVKHYRGREYPAGMKLKNLRKKPKSGTPEYEQVFDALPQQYQPSTENRSPLLLNFGIAINYKALLDYVHDAHDPSDYDNLPDVRDTSTITRLGIDMLREKCNLKFPLLLRRGLEWYPGRTDTFIGFYTNYTLEEVVRKCWKADTVDRVVAMLKQELQLRDTVKPRWYFAVNPDDPYWEAGWRRWNPGAVRFRPELED
ncbi:hypothetical protein EIP91_000850 [Steccherinum ochraceum]|uniref:Uncharacterized protein n=1 Tax=Steccherinum ochraceum TaxID=92696 RepID=A0A4R0S314_9APHY|nr:hypothetical protein EIP91_000850 [Steccherinum ochraceum]